MTDVAFVLVLATFVMTLVVLLLEKINEAAVTMFSMCLCGAVLVLTGTEVSPGHPMTFVDLVALIEWDTVLFLMSMMIVVALASSSGMFQYIALVLVQRTHGRPKNVYMAFLAFVFIISFFLDPLPTMLVMGPFTVEVCRALQIDFRPVLISEAVVSYFASFPSVVGSVPNLLIVFWAGIHAAEMFFMLLPLTVLLFLVTVPLLMRTVGKTLCDDRVHDDHLLMMISPTKMIRSRTEFYASAIGLGTMITGFVIAPTEVTFIALSVAAVMLAVAHDKATDLLKELSWITVFFLIGLFGIVNALGVAGVIAGVGGLISSIIGSNAFVGILIMIWIPGFALSAIDNIPVAAFLAPMAVDLGTVSRVVPVSLVIGANVGGYMIPFGDAPNMIVISLSESHGSHLTFREYTKATMPIATVHLIVSTLYCFGLALLF
ncbi:MAG: hypothetical protein HXY34_13280 [Candidatus Thorarchaeota archaeon]|nr:hypothetical protein [Candidatus Thorarchaeota archaeon]